MKNIIQEIKNCASVRINCCACGAGEKIYFAPESLIRKLEEAVAKIETPIPTCKDPLRVGNIAAIREALEAVVKVGYPHNFHREAPHIRWYCNEMAKAIKKCFAALSAPARNCDRFADELDAQIEFLNEVWLIPVDKYTMLERDKFENWTEEMKSRYANWLLAEAKGGAK